MFRVMDDSSYVQVPFVSSTSRQRTIKHVGLHVMYTVVNEMWQSTFDYNFGES